MGKLSASLGKLIFGADSKHEVPNKELFRYMFGIVGQNWMCGLMGWFMYFCTDVMYIKPMIIGTILAASRVWDAINDPLVGTLMDRYIFKNGEKLRPYLKLTAIPVGLLAALLFMDFGLPTSQYIIFIVVVYFLYDFIFSFQDIAQWSMTSVMATTSEERARVSQFARFASAIGALLPGLIPIMLDNADLVKISQKNMFVIFAAVFGVGGMIISLYTASAKERAPVKKVEGNPLSSIKLMLKNKIVVLIVIGCALNVCTLAVPAVYFFKYMVKLKLFGIEMNGLTVSLIYGIVSGIPGFFSMLLSVWFSKKVGGMRNVLIIAIAANIIFRLAALFIGYEGYRIFIVMILMSVASIPQGMVGVARTALWGDSLDYTEWKTGERNEGSVFAMQNFIEKLGSALSTFFTGVTLTILHFDATLYEQDLAQSEIFTKWIWPIYIGGPIIGSVMFLIPICMIKYNKKQKELLEKKLAYTRAVRAGDIIPAETAFKDYNNLKNREVSDGVLLLNLRAQFPKKEEKEEQIIW